MDEFGRTTNNVDRPASDDNNDTQDLVATNLNGQRRSAIQSRKRDEETAAEMTADDFDRPVTMEDDDTDSHASTWGWVALALSIVSFFIWPIVLGGAGIIVGFVAKSRDADTLGNTAIIAGAVSIIITLFILPFV
ncbi:DUF4190 domain-containing protein [Virgibacillus oceani]|uniref:DUF4190 domain-containing protein n=1 Tax=Virgibacillus oceani TaxID=1479511 RepID=A0A917H0A6_9BACI|nr:DUF4190 domain-containing protein [Virgibacillus oceani]GGG63531.1 hypothetical protein GCM10011398_03710 [Virgibacillus oceani]